MSVNQLNLRKKGGNVPDRELVGKKNTRDNSANPWNRRTLSLLEFGWQERKRVGGTRVWSDDFDALEGLKNYAERRCRDS